MDCTIPHAARQAGHGREQPMPANPEREALRLALAGLEAAEALGQPQALCTALTAVARGYRRLRALRAAEDALGQALRWAHACASVDQEVDLLCELAECACQLAECLGESEFRGAHAARDRARDAAFEASARARRVTDPVWERSVLLRISDILNRCGDHDDAAWHQSRALSLVFSGQG